MWEKEFSILIVIKWQWPSMTYDKWGIFVSLTGQEVRFEAESELVFNGQEETAMRDYIAQNVRLN